MKKNNSTALSTELDGDGIYTITINVQQESMNIFNRQVMEEFTLLAEDIDKNNNIKAVIFVSGKTDCFIAGADISMLQQAQTAEEGTAIVQQAHTMLQTIANSKKPYIAAIDGICLGAGYELSLACHYRIATNNPKTKIGLPEVMLGLLPGATGTTKLSRLIPLPAALDIILTGKQLDAKRALCLGMIDEVVPASILIHAAKKVARKFIFNPLTLISCRKKSSLQQHLLTLPFISHAIIYTARRQVLKKTYGNYPAPLAILDVIKYGLHKPISKALAYEAQKFGELTASAEAKQLMGIYFATTELKKESFIASKTSPTTLSATGISTLGILGGGLMGAGIATISLDKTTASVRMKDICHDGILSAQQHIDKYYKNRVKRRILSAEQAKQKGNRFTGTLDYSGFAQCDLIIEAVFEDLTVKQDMLADIEALGNSNTIFASNTSSIPIKNIAAKAKRPENIIGMHYFSPVEKMPLLEIIKHAGTSDKTIATAVNFGRQQGKTVIVVDDGAGFYVNRILVPYINAAMQLGMDGVAFDKIDQALTRFGFPVGPIKLLDEVGIDIGSKIQPILEKAFGERMQSCGIQETLIANGRLGKKVKKGFYDYSRKPKNSIDPSLYKELNIHKKIDMDEETIVERCLYPMLNEAAYCLAENIIQSPRDGDIGAIFGIGFPPFLGGPFRYMDNIGTEHIVAKLNTYEEQHGIYYKAEKNLEKHVFNNNTFYS
ncbi:MAG: 3-hydroxyacyl-CoA dehydrogenase/enoyl-CoA hydratase/3-hydroxybutyryl-CoA epimerase [Candidatus Endobugula sp.]|jgi:3-hydroxyacyl-CoA dehydrogenase/enoyl-CoA hydratase/3-hydroxybutyryl-CoA epimerase